ncbi:coiled-coil domain-containing protein [Rugosimonospora africana]|uniref:coiled-coil domain-containing protein n=1 Tax=Rugosimonospora africana TaxID=556532 RepID=UPI0019456590|nr:hypothetical protein [Rugosimonospora africana]
MRRIRLSAADRARRRRSAPRWAPLVAALGLCLLVAPGAAVAAPAPSPSPTHSGSGGTDPDGSPPSLQDQLTAASQAYTDAKGRLAAAQQAQADLTAKLAATQQRLVTLTASIDAVASRTYRVGQVGTLLTVFNSVSPDDFVQRALTLRQLAAFDDAQLRELRQVEATATTQKAELARQVNAAQTQTVELSRRKSQIQQALAITAGGPTSGVVIPAPSADPAPRNPDGSFPNQKCSEDDPTTSGCLTPRTLHAYQQARAAGFTHYVACWREQSWGEHPLGRACDFAAAKNGFGGVATGSDRDYGNRLAGYFIANADRLGVLYVIWYHQIWTPGVGWHYYKGDGTPSGDHMNHVHLSER